MVVFFTYRLSRGVHQGQSVTTSAYPPHIAAQSNQGRASFTKRTPQQWWKVAHDHGLNPGQWRSGKASVTCPKCGCTPKRSNRTQTVLFESGVIVCKRCPEGEGTTRLWEHYDLFEPVAGPHKLPEPARVSRGTRKKSRSRLIDVVEAHRVIESFQSLHRGALKRWALARHIPAPLAELIAQGLGCAQVIPSPQRVASSPAARALATLWPERRLALMLRDEHGTPTRPKRRFLGDAPTSTHKSLTTPTEVIGSSPQLEVFGFFPRALTALREGRQVIVVEGGPDYLVTAALVRFAQIDAVVLGTNGTSGMGQLARALRQALPGGAPGSLLIVPHHDKVTDQRPEGAGVQAARALAKGVKRLLRGGVFLTRTPRCWRDDAGESDIGDVLAAHGIEAVTELLTNPAHRERFKTAPTTSEVRPMITPALQEALDQGGEHAFIVIPGGGKSTAFIRLVIQASLERTIKVVVALPTVGLLVEKLNEARRVAETLGLDPGALDYYTGRNRHSLGGVCSEADHVARAAALTPGGGAQYCDTLCPFSKGCAARRRVQRWQRQPLESRAGAQVIFTTQASLQARWALNDDGDLVWEVATPLRGADIVAYDEDCLGLARQMFTLTPAQLFDLRELGLVANAEVLGRLAALVRGGVSGRKGRDATTVDLHAAVAPTDVLFDRTKLSIAARRQAVEELDARGKLMADSSPPWWAAKALVEAAHNGWRGAYVRDGHLSLPVRSFGQRALMQGEHATLLLDATLTPNIARAILPGIAEAGLKQLGAGLPVTARVVQYDWSATSSKLRQCEWSQQRWIALHRRHDNATTVHVTFKEFADVLREHVQGPVIHFGGAESRGSNAFEHCDRVVLDAWHIPQAELQSVAQWLILHGVDEDEALIEAGRHCIDAQVIQALGRIRPYNGELAQVVLLDERTHDLCIDEQRSAEVVAWEAGLGTQGKALMVELTRRVVAKSGGCLKASQLCPTVTQAHTILYMAPTEVTVGQPLDTVKYDVDAQWWVSAFRYHFGDSPIRLAEAAGLRCTFVDHSGGQPTAVFHSAALTANALRRAFLGHADWVRLNNQRLTLHSRLGAATRRLQERGEAITVKALIEESGASRSTVYRWIEAEAGMTASEYCACHAPVVVATPVEPVTIGELAAAPPLPDPTLAAVGPVPQPQHAAPQCAPALDPSEISATRPARSRRAASKREPDVVSTLSPSASSLRSEETLAGGEAAAAKADFVAHRTPRTSVSSKHSSRHAPPLSPDAALCQVSVARAHDAGRHQAALQYHSHVFGPTGDELVTLFLSGHPRVTAALIAETVSRSRPWSWLSLERCLRLPVWELRRLAAPHFSPPRDL